MLTSLPSSASGSAAGASVERSSVSVGTFAGDPVSPGAATALSLMPFDVAEHRGALLVAAGSVVRRVDLETGEMSTFAGVGVRADHAEDLGDGGPATAAVLGGVRHLAVGADGSVYLTESTGNRVRRVLPDGTITTIAGRNLQSFGGDGGPAKDALLYSPRGVAVDADGTVYVADHHNNRVRAIDPDGIIDTVAGNGDGGYAGDGASAVDAALNMPTGLALDVDGSLLIADSGNHRIRRVRNGVITTIAGTGDPGNTGGPGGDGDGTGELGDGGPAVDATLHEPVSVTVDGDGYLVADTLNHKIRRIDRHGVISTVAGGGTRNYGTDGVPATDTNLFAPERALRLGDGTMAIADTRGARVRRVDGAGIISGVAGNYYDSFSGDGGPATRAQLSGPSAMTVAPSGDVYFADGGNGGIVRRVRSGNGHIETVMGLLWQDREPPPDGSDALATPLDHAAALAADGRGVVYVADEHVIREIDVFGKQRVHAGIWGVGVDSGDGLHRRQATFVRPVALLAAADGSLYVGDSGAHRVRRIAPDGTVHAVAGTGTAGFAGDGGAATAAQLDGPSSLSQGPDGTLYVVDAGNSRIRAVSPDGGIRTVLGTGPGKAPRWLPSPALEATVQPSDVVALPDGDLAFTNNLTNLLHYDVETEVVSALAGGDVGWRDGAASAARFARPAGLAWDSTTEQLLVADLNGARIRVLRGVLTAESSPGGHDPGDGACPAGAVPEDGFVDVPADNVHEPAVDCLVWWGVARGVTATAYAPSQSVTRAQMATFLARTITSAGGVLPASQRDWFADDDGSPHEDSVNRLAEAGIVLGVGGGGYAPRSPVHRDQMATFLVRVHHHLGGEPLSADRDYFVDDDASPHEDNIDLAAARGLTAGLTDRTFGPELAVNRDHMASFVVRFLDGLVREGRAQQPA